MVSFVLMLFIIVFVSKCLVDGVGKGFGFVKKVRLRFKFFLNVIFFCKVYFIRELIKRFIFVFDIVEV